MSRMTVRAILLEAWSDVVTGTARTTLFAAALAAVVVTAILTDVLAVRLLAADADRFRSSGATVLTVQAEGRIDGHRCENLGRIPGVRASGAVRETDSRLTSPALRGAPIPVSEVTSGFPRLLSNDVDHSGGVVLSNDAADVFGVRPGGVAEAVEGRVRVAGRYDYPDDGRRPGYGYRALVTADARHSFDECWVDAWPQIPNLRSLLLFTVRSDTGADDVRPLLGQLNSSHGERFDGRERFEARVSRFAPAIAGIVAFGLATAAIRFRRIQLASALHARVPRRDLLAVQMLEASSWIVPAVCVGLALTALLAAGSAPGDRLTVAIIGSRILAVAGLGALGGTAAGVLFTREKHLFRYFKDR